MERNGLVEEIVSKVKVREIVESTQRSRDFPREVQALKVERGDRERWCGGAGDSSPVTVVSLRSVGPCGEILHGVFNGGLKCEKDLCFR